MSRPTVIVGCKSSSELSRRSVSIDFAVKIRRVCRQQLLLRSAIMSCITLSEVLQISLILLMASYALLNFIHLLWIISISVCKMFSFFTRIRIKFSLQSVILNVCQSL